SPRLQGGSLRRQISPFELIQEVSEPGRVDILILQFVRVETGRGDSLGVRGGFQSWKHLRDACMRGGHEERDAAESPPRLLQKCAYGRCHPPGPHRSADDRQGVISRVPEERRDVHRPTPHGIETRLESAEESRAMLTIPDALEICAHPYRNVARDVRSVSG